MDSSPKKRRRKKRKDTAKDRLLKETKDYERAQDSNLWRTERKFANEVMEGIRNLKLPLRIDKLTKYEPDSFYVAILQQMKRKSIYESLRENVSKVGILECLLVKDG